MFAMNYYALEVLEKILALRNSMLQKDSYLCSHNYDEDLRSLHLRLDNARLVQMSKFTDSGSGHLDFPIFFASRCAV